MSSDIGIAPDPAAVVFRHMQRLYPQDYHDMLHLHALPDGYNCHTDGLAIVVDDDISQVDESSYSRDLVQINVFGPDRALVSKTGRVLYAALTQGASGIGLGVSRSKSKFFGVGPSYQPTGFVSTMSISVGIGKVLATFRKQ